jgi:tRNA 5-methylaminomethyl-2-thiouridine biosynthesis bifunctional protein
MGDAPKSSVFDDVYFSASDGAAETSHVFLDGNNLPGAWQGRARFTIGETGFGTGLNFLMAWDLFERTAPAGAFLDYISVEKYPLSADFIRTALSPWAARLSPYMEKFLARYPLNIPGFHRIVFNNRVALTLVFGDVNDVLPEVDARVDAWFLDGFTPAKNPDMWTQNVFDSMARLSAPGARFATFTAAGFVKRGLQAAGFAVEKKKGFGPKRDMLAGNFTGLQGKENARAASSTILIHGAGLAGCAAAHAFRQYGLKPILHDPNGIASGASGNIRGLINPRFTAFRTAESDYYAAAFAMAVRELYKFEKCGSLHLITNEDKEKRFTRTCESWGWDQTHMRMLSPAEASDIAGVRVPHAALYLPDSGFTDPAALCSAYAKDIEIVQTPMEADTHVWALGAAMPAHESCAGLPIHTVRGQVTLAKPTAGSAALKSNLCYGGYITPAKDGVHMIGSTFQKWLAHTDALDADDAQNLDSLSAAVPGLGTPGIIGHRAGLRCAARDRFPVAGESLAMPGHFISAAHGSHGIVSSLLSGHILADMMRGGPLCVGKSTLNVLAPARFFRDNKENPL